METLFNIQQLSYRYFDKITALSGVTLSISAGERFAIIGANGSGKSTLLQLLNGLIFPSAGTIQFRGLDLHELALREEGFLRYFRERVGYVFQDSDVQLFCPTVLDELLYGPLQLAISPEEAEHRAREVLRMLGMENYADRPTYMLSGGEKKRVAIGSVLTMNPEVLLLDEPTNGLDPRTQSFLIDLLVSLNEAGKTIILATHDLNLVADLDMKVALMSEDHCIEKVGSAEEILGDDEILLRTNLIHEHRHIHGSRSHQHRKSHVAIHRHDPDLPVAGHTHSHD
jgi:cobalt/nickel transport system ATP-binding protein